MLRASTILMLCCIMSAHAFCQDQTKVERGTINVVVANDNGMVVLTDSMLTQTWHNANGVLNERQLKRPGQKLFRVDDKTVCAFAGFASARTYPVPDFLNSVGSIMARYQDSLKNFRSREPLSFSEKLDLLEDVVGYYLTGIANILDGSRAEDYTFELFLAGYDTDGTPEIGRLVLATVAEQHPAGSLLRSVTQEKRVFPIAHHQMVCLNGIDEEARKILRNADAWRSEPGSACEQSTNNQELLSVEQMKALAISLKQHTADRFPEVGGPSQIVVLTDGRVQGRVDQPTFAAITPSPFKFQIVSTLTANNSGTPGRPRSPGFVTDLFTLFFADQFIHVRVELVDAYFGKNVIRDSVVMYRGGKARLEKSNQVIDSDLEVAAGVPPNSPELKRLLHDFKWRTVTYAVNMPPRLAHPSRFSKGGYLGRGYQ